MLHRPALPRPSPELHRAGTEVGWLVAIRNRPTVGGTYIVASDAPKWCSLGDPSRKLDFDRPDVGLRAWTNH